MTGVRTGLVVGLVATGLLASAHWTTRAQENAKPADVKSPADGARTPRGGEEKAEGRATEGQVSVQDALERPFILPFGTPTRLEDVCSHLRRILRAPVVVDRAALERQEVRTDDTVELELHGVRLKTGLKLLLDQVGLTYRVEPGDNLLIITDDQGADDPLNRVMAELKAIHRDLHDVQDTVDSLRAALGVEEEGPKMRKPTIIEELPEQPAEKKVSPPSPQPRLRSGM